MTKSEQATANFRRDKFRRLLLGSAIGIFLAYSLPMSQSTVFVGLYPAMILLGMNRFSLFELLLTCLLIPAGAALGTAATETFQTAPLLVIPLSFALFLGVLKLFALRIRGSNAVTFIFTYSLGSIYASYPGETMEIAIVEQYPIQLALIFLIVWGCFAAFPAEMPRHRAAANARSATVSGIGNGELIVYAVIWTAIWLFFMLFEWRFALFAFLSFVKACNSFERDRMKQAARDNIIAHVLGCSIVAMFSLLVLGIISNPPVLATGLVLVLAPVLRRAVYPPRPELSYRCATMVSGVMVPLILYMGTDHAAVSQSMLRAWLIIMLMIILYLVIEYMHHGKKLIGAAGNSAAALKFRLAGINLNMGGKRVSEEHDRAPDGGGVTAADGLSGPQADAAPARQRLIHLSPDGC